MKTDTYTITFKVILRGQELPPHVTITDTILGVVSADLREAVDALAPGARIGYIDVASRRDEPTPAAPPAAPAATAIPRRALLPLTKTEALTLWTLMDRAWGHIAHLDAQQIAELGWIYGRLSRIGVALVEGANGLDTIEQDGAITIRTTA